MAEEEIEISELEFRENLSGDDLIPVETSTNTFATSLTALKNWLKSFFVGMTGDETIGGIKTFSSSPKAPTPATNDNSTNLATTEFVKTQGYATDANVIKTTGNQTKSGTLTLTASPILPTPSSDDNSTKGSTTAFVKNILSANGKGLASYSKSGNGYYKFTNGLIIQWGLASAGSTTQVTFPTAFTSTNYRAVCTNNGDSGYIYAPVISATTKTTMTILSYSGAAGHPNFWIAVGY